MRSLIRDESHSATHQELKGGDRLCAHQVVDHSLWQKGFEPIGVVGGGVVLFEARLVTGRLVGGFEPRERGATVAGMMFGCLSSDGITRAILTAWGEISRDQPRSVEISRG